MKQKALCVFALLTWILAACTALSLRVEVLMLPEVDQFQTAGGVGIVLPFSFLQTSETGGDHLFGISEGSGWEGGSRAKDVPFTASENGLRVEFGSKSFIHYSSRPLKNGEEVRTSALPNAADTWLVLPQEGGTLPGEFPLPRGASLEAREGDMLLLSFTETQQPFLRNRAKDQILTAAQEGTDGTGEAGALAATVHSLGDVERFLRELPKLGLLLGLFLFTVVLWAFCCVFSRRPRENRGRLLLNILLGIAVLAVFALTVQTVDLPSSLLPSEYVVDLGHYSREFGEIFGALEGFSDSGVPQAVNLLSQFQTGEILAAVLAAAPALAALVIGVVEGRSMKKKKAAHRRSFPRHGA